MPRGSLIRTLSIAGALLLSSAVARGQGAPGTNLTVAVSVQRVQIRGDTVLIQYVVRNSPRSAEELWNFTVDAPSRPLRVVRPQARERWTTGVSAQGLQVARWAALGANIAAGARTPPLEFSALGLPAMVTYWAGGYFPVPDYEPVDEDTLPALSPRQGLAANAVPGQTIGVEPFPTDLSPGNLLARLRALTDSACSLGWINGRGICRELAEHLDQTARELQRGRREEARQHLREFVRDLRERSGRRPGEGERGDDEREERQDREDHGASVNSSAYWLLTVNADYLLTRLCETGERCREDR